MSLTEAQARLLTEPNPAIVTTLRADGSAHSTLTWIDWDGEFVIVNTVVGRMKEKHLRRDDRITVAVSDRNQMERWVGLEGRAEMTTEGAEAHVHRLTQKYRGEDFPLRPGMERLIIKFRPERVYGLYDDKAEAELMSR